MVRRNRLKRGEALSAWASFSKIPVRLVSCNIQAALEIAFSRRMYAYDAYFLQVARETYHPLLTLDQRMIDIAAEMAIDIVELKK